MVFGHSSAAGGIANVACLFANSLKRRDVRRRNFACRRVPSMVWTWAGSYVDRAIEENALFKTLHFKVAGISSNNMVTPMLVGRLERLPPSTSSRPIGIGMTGICRSAAAAVLAIPGALL